MPASDWGVTFTDLKEWADYPSNGGDEVVMTNCLDACQEFMVKRLDADLLGDPIDEDVRIALLMRSAGLYRRRQTQTGYGGLGDGISYRVNNYDPDVEKLEDPYRCYGIG